MAEEKELPKKAVLKNRTEENQVFFWDGVPYIWRPGESMQVDIDIAGRFVGMPEVGLVLEDDSDLGRLHEKERVADLLPQDKRGLPHPLEVVEIIDPKAIMAEKKEFVSVPSVEKDEGETPFASLEVNKDMVGDVPKIPDMDMTADALRMKKARDAKAAKAAAKAKEPVK